MKAEYIEGPKAREYFEKLAKVLFQAPKTVTKPGAPGSRPSFGR